MIHSCYDFTLETSGHSSVRIKISSLESISTTFLFMIKSCC